MVQLKDSSLWDQQWEDSKEAEALFKNNIRCVLDNFVALLDKRLQSLLTEKWNCENPTQGWISTWNDEIIDWLRHYSGGILRLLLKRFVNILLMVQNYIKYHKNNNQNKH